MSTHATSPLRTISCSGRPHSPEPAAALSLLPHSTVHAKAGGLPESPENRRSRLQIAIVLELLSCAALSYVVARYVSRPIRELRSAAARLARGDLAARVDIEGKDEVAALQIGYRGRKLTISAGYASVVPGAAQTEEGLLQEADKALYAAKSAGGNRARAYARS